MTAVQTSIEQKLDKEIASIIRHSGIHERFYAARKDISYSDFMGDKLLMIQLIKEGVPYSLFNLIQHYTPFSEADWATLLHISAKSLQRYKQADKKFGNLQSEKIIEMAEVTSAGLGVFGNMEKFRLWLHTPNYALGDLKPMELLGDSYGKDLVIGELTRINYGIFA